MEKRLLLIVNPNSGDGIARHWVYDMIDILSKRYESVTVYFSKGVGDIIRFAQENARNFDALVCCGGDGTLNESLNGILSCGARIPMGYIPTGTTNDFATSHKIPKNIKAAIQRLVTAAPHPYDTGTLGERAFTYVAAFGAFIDVCYKTPQSDKASFGKMAYVAEGAKRLSELKVHRLTVTDSERTVTGDFIFGMVSNSTSVAGFRFFPSETPEMLSDGKFEVTLVNYPNTAAELQQALRELTMPQLPSKLVTRFTTKDAKFTFMDSPPDWTLDGEYGGTYRTVNVSVNPGGILLLE